MSHGKMFSMKVVGNFLLMLIDIKSSKTVFRSDLGVPTIEGHKSSFRIPKVGDVIYSNSCHMRSFRPSHDLRDLWDIGGFTMKVLEVPKSP
jgi:hypothetical protein